MQVFSNLSETLGQSQAWGCMQEAEPGSQVHGITGSRPAPAAERVYVTLGNPEISE